MNFFEEQDRAQRNTKRLVFLLCMAVLSLIAVTTLLCAAALYYIEMHSHRYMDHVHLVQGIKQTLSWKMVSGISIGVCTVIFLGSLFKLLQLSSGGRVVAESMGGRPIDHLNANADEKKILNVVEEMAIASGTPVPPVYIIEDESMNAFAAGHTPQDAVIGVTRGLIRVLKRDELQGVIAHEFSHIFHGDMKLNMRLVALLNGILLLGLIGEFIFRNASLRGSSRDKSPFAMMGFGVGLMVIGYAGTFFGGLIKAAVSRQREFLADASAVKFTRNPDGIGGALKKLGGYVGGSQLDAANAAEFSHMFFSEGATSSFMGMATHPPLNERIKRIDPRWDGSFTHIDVNDSANDYIEEAITPAAHDGSPINFASPKNAMEFAVTVDQVLQTVGQPNQSHLAYARKTLDDLSDSIKDAAHSPWEAQGLMFGLMLDPNIDMQQKQLRLLEELFPAAQIASLHSWALQASLLAPRLRLPLVEMSLPALKNLSPQQYQVFKQAMIKLIHADGQINLIEWSFFRILVHNLEPKKSAQRLFDLTQLQKESRILLSVIANAGAANVSEAQTAFDSCKHALGFSEAVLLTESEYTMMDLDLAITRLNCVKPLQKPKLLKAMSQCVLADQRVTVEEAEVFRAMADALDCPVPPLIVAGH